VAAEPLRESAHRVLTEVHLAEGNVGEARQLYERWRRLLDTEFGLRPTARFDELFAAVGGSSGRR
jgi:DNA-binding SARP family transcriptional activator